MSHIKDFISILWRRHYTIMILNIEDSPSGFYVVHTFFFNGDFNLFKNVVKFIVQSCICIVFNVMRDVTLRHTRSPAQTSRIHSSHHNGRGRHRRPRRQFRQSCTWRGRVLFLWKILQWELNNRQARLLDWPLGSLHTWLALDNAGGHQQHQHQHEAPDFGEHFENFSGRTEIN